MSLPLQKARYQAQAFQITFGMSSNNNTQIAVVFEITADAEFTGESIPWVGHFTDKTAQRTIESLQHAGWQGDDLSELDGLDDAGVRAILPNVVELVCEPEEYEGEWRLRVQWVNKPGGGRFAFKEPLTGSGLKAFAAQMRSTVHSVRSGGGTQRRQSSTGASGGSPQRSLQRGGSAPHPNAPGERDDIPF